MYKILPKIQKIISVIAIVTAMYSIIAPFKTLADTPTPTPSPTPISTVGNGSGPIVGEPGGNGNLGIGYIGCGLPGGKSACPDKLVQDKYYESLGEKCATGDTFQAQYDEWKKSPYTVHLWVADEQITAQGKADERARQFIYWVLSHPSIDDHQTLKTIWNFSRNIALFFTLLIASVFGIGIIIAQRQNFDLKVEVSPLIIKLIFMLLYIVMSAAIILSIIKFSELLMQFFIENLGGRDLFNIYFTANSGEKNYLEFNGCRDLNLRVSEAYHTELLMLKLTNITYYVMGVMLLLRKIILWFLLFVSPFLAILMPFVFIRNIGWIWIGVFFQWVFYGPLFALFLGALAQIWKKGIPFPFNFARTNSIAGYVYPSAFNIAYGGPAQEWTAARPPYTNNGNYVDTFAEYIITLIMLWAVTFFPWWLLRIFRDYCCDGILAMKNILLSMYDQMRGGPSPSGPTAPSPIQTFLNTSLQIPKNIEVPVTVKLETIEEVKKLKTEELSKTLQLSVSKLTDVAHYETNKTTQQTVNKNIEYLQNPMKATNTNERQKYMNIRTELFNRSVKEDKIAQSILTATSTSKIEQMQRREEIVKTMPEMKPVTHLISVKVQMPQERVKSISANFFNSIANNQTALSSIAQTTNVSQPQVKTILTSYTQNTSAPSTQIISNVAKETNISRDQVRQVLKETSQLVSTTAVSNSFVSSIEKQTGLAPAQVRTILKTYTATMSQPIETTITNLQNTTNAPAEKIQTVINLAQQRIATSKNIVKQVAAKEQVKEEEVQKVITAQSPLVVDSQEHIEQAVPVPATVSLEDYEEVKKMWTEQYEKGEVPVNENVKTRVDWVDQDVVLITNTLNKLLSNDEKLRQEGLDDVGYLLPIFMINNLSGEELMVYLKAKLEAAKAVIKQLTKKEDATEKVEEEEEEVLVDAGKKKEEEKTMQLEDAQEIPEEEKKEDDTTPKVDQPHDEATKNEEAPAQEKLTEVDAPIEKKQAE